VSGQMNKYFAFIKEVQVIKYHTVLIEATNEEEARLKAKQEYYSGTVRAQTINTECMEITIKPNNRSK